MTDEPQNPWLDDQIFLGGLTIIHQGFAAFFDNLLAQKEEGADRLPAKVIASPGTSMVETGNALVGRVINNLPDGMKYPPFPADTLPGNRPGQG